MAAPLASNMENTRVELHNTCQPVRRALTIFNIFNLLLIKKENCITFSATGNNVFRSKRMTVRLRHQVAGNALAAYYANRADQADVAKIQQIQLIRQCVRFSLLY
jgi:hypothetical protein